MVALLHRVVQVLDHLVPPRHGRVVCHSSPDLDDMVVALLATTPPGVAVTVLADDARQARRRMRDLGLRSVPVLSKGSPRGLVTYLRSEYSISTHGLFGCLPRGRRKRSSTPWHGELSKQIGALIGQPGKHFDMTAVSSLQSKFLRSTEFRLPPTHTHVIGTPRQSTLLAGPRSGLTASLKADERWVVFVPTYRRSARSAVTVDNTLSIESQEEALAQLDEAVRGSGGVLWVRPHPVADPYEHLPERVRMATDEDLQRSGLTFYDLLAATDLLVTDYSSVWVDFLLTGRPVLGFCPDIEEYRNARGLALEPYDAWFPGHVTTTAEALSQKASELLAGHDELGEKRAWVRSVLCPDHPRAAEDYWSVLLERA